MPLSARARIEVYLPDLWTRASQELLLLFNQEFTYTFGGATILRGLDGSYLSHLGQPLRDRVNLIYTDTPFSFAEHFALLSASTDKLRGAVVDALEEEAVLIVALPIYHAA